MNISNILDLGVDLVKDVIAAVEEEKGKGVAAVAEDILAKVLADADFKAKLGALIGAQL